MQISHEVPIDLLDISYSFNSYCYCLVHLLPQYTKYRDHYFNAVKDGRRVLLDNSIFELGESYNPVEFANWIKELKPTEYVIPDVLEDAQKTKSNFIEFIQTHDNLPGNAIGVLQGKTYEEIKDLYLFFVNEPKIKKIAVSFDYSYYLTEECKEKSIHLLFNGKGGKWWQYCFGRISLIERLVQDKVLQKDKSLHLLGCSVPLEFSFYRYLDLDRYIDTIDTSNPIVAGILGKRYTDYGLDEKWGDKLVDYIDTRLSSTQVKDIWYNVNKFRKIVHK